MKFSAPTGSDYKGGFYRIFYRIIRQSAISVASGRQRSPSKAQVIGIIVHGPASCDMALIGLTRRSKVQILPPPLKIAFELVLYSWTRFKHYDRLAWSDQGNGRMVCGTSEAFRRLCP
jgi:hypothetical protein